ncbi:trigger factor [Candidatus Saccharibacteria bacterium]|nr:trigger factor [Candidatus Saccharibacteria bacterium]
MQVKKSVDKTQATITISAHEADLSPLKQHVLQYFQKQLKLPGFRQGKVPLAMVEKNVDPGQFQSEFLEEAISQMYAKAAQDTNIRPISRPEVELKKFVPFTELEFEVKVVIIGEIKLGDYKKLTVEKPDTTISAQDVKGVIKSLQTRLAEKKDVKRAAKMTDQVWIDFTGVDAKNQPVQGADGKDYPLVLGSNTFIPGFEPNLIGMKSEDEKTFELTFPKDYQVQALASKKVTFTVVVTKVQEVMEPKADDEFAVKAGPFKTLAELKDDIKKQLKIERENQASREVENQLVTQLADKSSVEIPDILITEQIEKIENEERQNLAYRGQTWEEHLKEEGVTAEEHKEQKREAATGRVKMGLVLSGVADAENITVTPEELEIRMQILKGQYKDAAMQSELDKPEARQDIASRILTEKTLAILIKYNSTK